MALQVQVLTEQVSAQSDKIADLERIILDKTQQLSQGEDLLQRVNILPVLFVLKVKCVRNILVLVISKFTLCSTFWTKILSVSYYETLSVTYFLYFQFLTYT